MEPVTPQIPLANLVKIQTLVKQQSQPVASATHGLFKNGLTSSPVLFTAQSVKLMQTQLSQLQGDHSSPQISSESLLPSLLDQFNQILERKEETNQQNANQEETVLAEDDSSVDSKLQALRDLIEDFDMEKDTDFLDLSRWVMNINNEMNVDEK